MKQRLLLTVLFAVISVAARATPTDFDLNRKHNAIGIVVGAHYWKSPWAELGLSYARSKNGCIFGGYYKATSINLYYNPIESSVGVGVSRWSSHFGFFVTGLRLSAYSDFEVYNLTLQPQAGIGNGVFSLCYGHHFAVFSDEIVGMNLPHEISFRWNFEVKEIEKDKWWKRK